MKRTPILRNTLFALALAAGANLAVADEFAEGFFAAEQGDYAKAVDMWLPLAKQGNADAQFNIALLYHSGAAGKIDEKRAVQWYRKAAENGHHIAQEYLAVGYEEGWFGLKKDARQANYWEAKLQYNR